MIYRKAFAVDGVSCKCPPWGWMIAVDLYTGEVKWRVSLYAYDASDGRVLAKFDLPAGFHAGPIMFKSKKNSKQYLVVAPGGHSILGSKLGDYIIAYTIPEYGKPDGIRSETA